MIVKICEISQFTRATPGSSLVIYLCAAFMKISAKIVPKLNLKKNIFTKLELIKKTQVIPG